MMNGMAMTAAELISADWDTRVMFESFLRGGYIHRPARRKSTMLCVRLIKQLQQCGLLPDGPIYGPGMLQEMMECLGSRVGPDPLPAPSPGEIQRAIEKLDARFPQEFRLGGLWAYQIRKSNWDAYKHAEHWHARQEREKTDE